jgi:hypothetical protein
LGCSAKILAARYPAVDVRFTLSSVHKVPSSRPRSWSERRRILAYFGNLRKVHLLLVSHTPIQRHVKVKGEANPYDLRLRNLLRETRSGSYGGDVSGYSNTSLSLEVPTRDLPRMQYTDHPNHGMASSSSCPPCDRRVQECREPRFASSRVPRQGSPPRDFCITTASPRKRRSKGLSRMTGNRHVRF